MGLPPPFHTTFNTTGMAMDSSGLFQHVAMPQMMFSQYAPAMEVTTALSKIRIWVPANVIGAIIGAKVFT
jgi:hypothetical protein